MWLPVFVLAVLTVSICKLWLLQSKPHTEPQTATGFDAIQQQLAGSSWTPFTERPMVYIAAPYTVTDPVENTNRAIAAADLIAGDGIVTPLVPHLSLAWQMVKPHSADWWYEYDYALLSRCDALLRLPGKSPGADDEVEWCLEAEIPVFHDLASLYAWVDSEQSEEQEEEA